MIHSTTILAVRHRDRAVLAGDGQVTFGQTVVKQSARKIRRLYNDRILAGFAGSAADSFALFARFEAKLEQYRGNLERSAVELAKDWRTDRILRRLEAMLIVLDKTRDVPAVGHRRSDRARRRDRGDRIGRAVRAGGGARRWRATPSSTRARSPRRRWRSPARSASTPTRNIVDRRAVEPWPFYLPETHADVDRLADAARRSSPSSTSTSSARRRPSAPSRSRCATGCAGRSCRPSWPRRSRRRTS